jgi:hypothetical protein
MNKKKLYQRFSKDYNLPINIFDEEYFEYYKILYKDFFPNEQLNYITRLIEDKYDGNVELWLDYCASVRDNAINWILENEKYKEFNTSDLTKYNIELPCGERNCYSEETNGKFYLSVDLKQANFQALKYVGVIDDNSYESFIRRFDGDVYIAGSKYLRQVIFGKCNPSRQIKVEKYLMNIVYFAIKNKLNHNGFKVFSFNSDEVVFEASSDIINKINTEGLKSYKDEIQKLIEELYGIINKYLNIDVTIEFNKIESLNIFNSNGNKIDAYVKRNCITGKEKLKKASTTFYPQIYKLYKGLGITKMDRTFYFENQLASFNLPLIKNY